LPNTFNLPELLHRAGSRMRADLHERLIPHAGELGTAREEVIREFLRSYLPKRFEIASGFAFDASGNASRQLDIIIADALTCPRFEAAGGARFYPCEAIVAVGQVKSSLTSVAEFEEALENLASAKRLDRSASGSAVDWRTAEPIDNILNHRHQVFTFLFVTSDILSEEAVRDALFEFVQANDPHVWPNVIIAVNHYLATFCCDGGICPNPMCARGIAFQDNTEERDILMYFYLLLGRALDATTVGSMPYREYLRHAQQFNARVWHSTTDNPPPFLSSI
jgi:hypothetical protein